MSHPEDELEDSAAPLIEHLAELRTRLIRSVIAFFIAMLLCFTVGDLILKFLLVPIENTMRDLGDPNPSMIYTAPQEYFFTLMRISIVFGLGLSFPVIAHQLWRFVAPGLYRSEKSAFLPFLIASPVLFVMGAAFAHYVVTPLAMRFFLTFPEVAQAMWDWVLGASGSLDAAGADASEGVGIDFLGKVNETLDITLKMILAFGLCFQLPVLLTLMGKAGLVNSDGLKDVRKYAVVGILVLAGLITPPDVVTQMILFVVVYGLYEVSIQLVVRVEKKREDQLREDGFYDDEEAFDLAEAEDDPRG